MKIDANLRPDLNLVRDRARELEAMGYDGLVTTEIAHDPFLPLVLAADGTSQARISTGIAIAFARNPMNLANLGHDLNAFSQGRFTLGLGSQIRPHITKRFSMPWSAPAARMREMIEALHAIWDCWYDEKPLHFKGKFYEHSLMTPGFVPQDKEFGRPKVTVAAVGPKMNEAAAAVADGAVIHPFSSEKYIRDVILPRIEQGLSENGRSRHDFEISYPPFIVTGETEEAFTAAKEEARRRISFYGSTPAYKGVLDIHGWGDLQPELNRMSKIGQWDEMPTLIDDDMLAAYAVIGEPEQVMAEVRQRFGGLLDRVKINLEGFSDERRSKLIGIVRAA